MSSSPPAVFFQLALGVADPDLALNSPEFFLSFELAHFLTPPAPSDTPFLIEARQRALRINDLSSSEIEGFAAEFATWLMGEIDLATRPFGWRLFDLDCSPLDFSDRVGGGLARSGFLYCGGSPRADRFTPEAAASALLSGVTEFSRQAGLADHCLSIQEPGDERSPRSFLSHARRAFLAGSEQETLLRSLESAPRRPRNSL